jgi:hypothetical protein
MLPPYEVGIKLAETLFQEALHLIKVSPDLDHPNLGNATAPLRLTSLVILLYPPTGGY